MKKYSTTSTKASRLVFENLESFARDHIQQFLQTMLEDEVRELFQRDRYERRA